MSQHRISLYMRDVTIWALVALAHLCPLWSWPSSKAPKMVNSPRRALRVEQIALQERAPINHPGSAKPQTGAVDIPQLHKIPLPGPSEFSEDKNPPKPRPSSQTSRATTVQKPKPTAKRQPLKTPVGKDTLRPKPPLKTTKSHLSKRISAQTTHNSKKVNGRAQKANGNAQNANGNAQKANGNAQKANGNAQKVNGNAQRAGVSKNARAALAALVDIGQITSEKAAADALKTSVNRTEHAALQEAYSSQLISFLQQELQLPEYGAVCVHLQLSSEGGYLAHQVITADSRANRAHLEARLPKLTFPKTQLTGDKVRSFTLNFNNRL